MNKSAITPDFISHNIGLLMHYFVLRGLKVLPKRILTGSTALHFLGQISRQPNDIDLILECSKEDMTHIAILVKEYGEMTGAPQTESGYNKDKGVIFQAIEIKGIKFDFWITCHKTPTLQIGLPNSSIHLATPEYTWGRKLGSCNPSDNQNAKECQVKGLADIHESLDLFRARELKLLTYIMAKPPQVQVVIHSPMHTNTK